MPTLEATRTPHHTLIRCQGNLTIYEAATFHGKLSPLLEPGAILVVDLSEVDELDTAGLQILLWARRQQDATQGSVRFQAPSAPVTETLHLFGLEVEFSLPPRS